MNNKWIKLYQSLGENEVLRDPHALQVLIWIFTHIDLNTNQVTLGRFVLARELKLKPSTARDALYRLSNKYKITTQTSDNKQTTISLINWDKYQSVSKSPTPETTPSRQQDDTYIKNKELRNNIITNVIIPEESGNNHVLEEKLETKAIPVKKPHPYAGVIEYCKVKQNLSTGFVNYVKQTTAVKRILAAGYTLEDIHFVIDEMVIDPYWKDNPFDLMSVSNQMHKYMNRTVMYDVKKGANKRVTVS